MNPLTFMQHAIVCLCSILTLQKLNVFLKVILLTTCQITLPLIINQGNSFTTVQFLGLCVIKSAILNCSIKATQCTYHNMKSSRTKQSLIITYSSQHFWNHVDKWTQLFTSHDRPFLCERIGKSH